VSEESDLRTSASEKRLRPLYLTAYFQGFVLWYAIDKLFMRAIGFNNETVAITTIIYILAMMTSSVPLGILADRWSRKGVLHIATMALIASSVVCGLSWSVWSYTAGYVLWAVFFGCYLGTYDSIVYDVLVEETGSADEFERYYGKVQAYNSAALVLGALTCAAIARFMSLRAEFWLSVPFSCCALASLRTFREPVLHRRQAAVRVTTQFAQVVRAISQGTDVRWIVLCLVCNSVAMRLVLEFNQLWFIALAMPVSWYGPAVALLYLGIGSGGLLARKLRPATIAVVGFLTLAASFGLMVHVPVVVVLAEPAVIVGIIALDVVVSRYLHDALPSAIRAGASSAAGIIGWGAFIPVALAFGAISRKLGMASASWLVTGALSVMVASLCVILYRRAGDSYPRGDR
jgi:MFS family permease